jgi:hypothetical protein
MPATPAPTIATLRSRNRCSPSASRSAHTRFSARHCCEYSVTRASPRPPMTYTSPSLGSRVVSSNMRASLIHRCAVLTVAILPESGCRVGNVVRVGPMSSGICLVSATNDGAKLGWLLRSEGSPTSTGSTSPCRTGRR